MTMFAPAIAAIASLVAGLAVLIWMNRNQPILAKPAPGEADERGEPSLEDIWYGRVKMPAPVSSYKVNIHQE